MKLARFQGHGLTQQVIRAFLFIMLGLGIVFRFTLLDSGSLWADEAFTSWVTQAPWSGFWDFLRFDNHPPLYYLFIRGWGHLFSFSDLSLRLPSAIIGTLTIGVMAWAAYIFFGRRAILPAAAIASASSFLLFYSREARMYEFIVFFGLLSLITFWRWLERPTPIRFLLYCLMTLLALGVHYSSAVFVVAEALFFIFSRRYSKAPFGAMVGAVLLFFAAFTPWLMFNILPRVLHPLQLKTFYFIPATDPWIVLRMFWGYPVFDGFLVQFATSIEARLYLLLRPMVLAVTWGAIVYFFRSMKDKFHPKITYDREVRTLALLCSIVFLLLMAGIVTGIYYQKYYIAGVPAFILLVAAGYTRLIERRPRFALIGISILMAFAVCFLPVTARSSIYYWRDTASYLDEHARSVAGIK